MPNRSRKGAEFPDIPKAQITDAKMWHNYFMATDPEYREKYGKKQ